MKIKYVHFSEPDREKIIDSENAYSASIGLIHALGGNPTQKEYDEQLLEHFADDQRKGVILSYEVLDYHSEVRRYRG